MDLEYIGCSAIFFVCIAELGLPMGLPEGD